MQTLRVNNLGTLRIKNAKFSGYYYYMNMNIWRSFQIYISVPLSETWVKNKKTQLELYTGEYNRIDGYINLN